MVMLPGTCGRSRQRRHHPAGHDQTGSAESSSDAFAAATSLPVCPTVCNPPQPSGATVAPHLATTPDRARYRPTPRCRTRLNTRCASPVDAGHNSRQIALALVGHPIRQDRDHLPRRAPPCRHLHLVGEMIRTNCHRPAVGPLQAALVEREAARSALAEPTESGGPVDEPRPKEPCRRRPRCALPSPPGALLVAHPHCPPP